MRDRINNLLTTADREQFPIAPGLSFLSIEYQRVLKVSFNQSIRETLMYLKEQIESIPRKGQVEMRSFASLAEKVSLILNLSFQERWTPEELRRFENMIQKPALPLSAFDFFGSSVDNLVLQRGYILLPLAQPISVEDMLELRAIGILVIGLTDSIQIVDGRKFLPGSFFDHDVGHIGIFLENLAKRGYRFDLDKQLKFHRAFEAKLAQISDPFFRRLVQLMWFEVFFEEGAPYSYDGLLEFHYKLDSVNNLESFFNKLKDPNFFGGFFPTKKPHFSDVQEAANWVKRFEFGR